MYELKRRRNVTELSATRGSPGCWLEYQIVLLLVEIILVADRGHGIALAHRLKLSGTSAVLT